ncbi:MAG: monovalent cation/H+ antiporter subunit D family protein, partial [Desulfobacteraceae bacterium]|nr:monovalent cation/H+ antiporter subunit D family protein [Desulfobacteraceae bacterium]
METIITSKIVLTPLIPLVTALLIMGSKNKPNLRETWSVCGALLTFLSVVYFLPRLLGGGSYEYTMFTLYPGVSVKFQLDGLGILFAG